MKTIIKNPSLDPLVILFNSDLYYIKQKDKIISFLTIKRYFNKYYEMGTLYTAPEYRNRGYANKLMKEVIPKYKDIVVICHGEKIISLNKKHGLKKTNKAGFVFDIKRNFFNFLFAPLLGYKKVTMRKQN